MNQFLPCPMHQGAHRFKVKPGRHCYYIICLTCGHRERYDLPDENVRGDRHERIYY